MISPTMTRVLSVAAFAAAFALLVLLPGNRKLKAARAESAALREQMEVEALQIECLDAVQQRVNLLREGTRDFSTSIPSEHRLGDFLRGLGGVLQRNGMENHILQPRPVHAVAAGAFPAACAATFAGMQAQPVLVQCEGRFSGVFDSLKDLEDLPRLSRVERLTLASDPAKPGKVKMEMLLETYFLPPVAAPEKTASAERTRPR